MMNPSMSTLESRVRAEFNEMPGERLTVAQASRLWGVNTKAAVMVLNRLVDSGFLRRVRQYYFRADLGHRST
jgi:Fic family protein